MKLLAALDDKSMTDGDNTPCMHRGLSLLTCLIAGTVDPSRCSRHVVTCLVMPYVARVSMFLLRTGSVFTSFLSLMFRVPLLS